MRISSTAMRHADAIVSAFSQRLYSDAFRLAERLGRTTVDIADVDAVADEITRLRLTDEEREAVEWAAEYAEDAAYKKLTGWPADEAVANTLRNLLEKLK